jgi:hypothetical protein
MTEAADVGIKVVEEIVTAIGHGSRSGLLAYDGAIPKWGSHRGGPIGFALGALRL